MTYHVVEGLKIPFRDFFDTYSKNQDSVYAFGQKSRDAAMSHVRKFKHVIDVGAHVGISVLHWANHFEKITAFEPMSDHYYCLKENTEHLNNVRIINCAVGDHEGKMIGSYRTKKNSGSFQLLDDTYRQPKNLNKQRTLYEIDVKKLDSYDFDNVDLIKIDVEGWELEVLVGAKSTIKKHLPILMIEFLGGKTNKSLHEYDVQKYHQILDDLGYKEITRINGDSIYQPLQGQEHK